MDAVDKTPFAWEPVTPRGVAAFADCSLRRLWLVQLIIAILAAAVVLWFLLTAWFPVIEQAIRKLPAQGSIRAGRLEWKLAPTATFAENHFLALTVDLRHEGAARSPANVQVEFGEKDVALLSLFGAVQKPYPHDYLIAFNRDELEPWWGAWKPAILALTALGVICWLMLTWGLLAALYCPAAWLVAFFANRVLSWRGAYRLCGAALMVGALLLTLAIALYGLGILDVLLLLIMAGAHFLVGWIYICWAPFWRPHLNASGASRNPFNTETQPGEKDGISKDNPSSRD